MGKKTNIALPNSLNCNITFAPTGEIILLGTARVISGLVKLFAGSTEYYAERAGANRLVLTELTSAVPRRAEAGRAKPRKKILPLMTSG